MPDHAHMLLRKRQRAATTATDESNITVPVDPNDVPAAPTSASRRPRVRSSAAADADLSTTATRARAPTSISPSLIATTSAVIAVPSLPATPTTSPATSNTVLAETQSPTSAKSTSSTGKTAGIAVAVVLIALLVLGAIAFFFIRKRKRSKQALFGAGKKEEDEQSFIGGKGEKYGMNDLAYGTANQGQGKTGWEDASNLSYVRTPSGSGYGGSDQFHHPSANVPPVPQVQPQDRSFDRSSFGASAQSHQLPPGASDFNAYPSSNAVNPFNNAAPASAQPGPGNAFAPPKAAMMGMPSARLSVQNPYGAAAQPNANLPVINSPPIAEEAEGPFADPEWEGKHFKVVRTFEPSQSDELIIMPGDNMQILVKYDDDWCLGYNLDRPQPVTPGEQLHNGLKSGVFPYNCVEEVAPPAGGSGLQRAPTLPPLDTGSRVSTTFGTTFAQGSSQQPAVSREAHLSSSSSVNQEAALINEFPSTPAANPHLQRLSTTDGRVKRTSSLLASKDADLFKQLGQALNTDSPSLK